MQSFEAIQASINGKTVDHAKRLGLSLSMVGKWQAPSTDFTDSGAYNPLDRLETIIETSLALGNGPERAFAPVRYLAERFGLIVIQPPPPCMALPELHQELARVIKEFGDVLTVSGASFADGEVSKKEAARIKKEANEVLRAVTAFIAKVEEAAG